MFVNLFLTLGCNLRCSYCYVDKPTGANTMPPSTAMDSIRFILDTARKQHIQTLGVAFSGGEPLLCWETIQRIVQTVQDCNDITFPVSYLLTTNGTLLTNEIIQFFEQHDFKVSLSLDGPQVVHDTHRLFHNGTGSFDTINHSISMLLAVRPETVARITFTPETVTSLSASVRFAAEQGFDTIKPVPDYFNGQWTAAHITDCEAQFADIFRWLPDFWVAGRPIKIGLIEQRLHPRRVGTCQAGLSSEQFTIGPHGDIYPCSYLVTNPQFIVGDVVHGIDPGKAQSVHCIHQQPFARQACQGCVLFNTCQSGRCTFMNLQMTGQMDTPSPFYCTFERMLVRVVKQYRVLVANHQSELADNENERRDEPARLWSVDCT